MGKDMSNDLPCPSCGFLTVEGSYGSYDICKICGWEDDGVQLANPYSAGGANGESLAEAQKRSLGQYPLSVEVSEGIKRSPKWRPLSEKETEIYSEQKRREHWHNTAVLYEAETYWRKNP
jgi:hypothetical protein